VSVGDRIDIDLPDTAADVAVTVGEVWVTQRSGSVSVASPSGEITGQFSLEPGLGRLQFDGASVWALNGISQSLTRVDAGSRTVVGDYPLPGGAPTYLAVGNDTVWVTAEVDESVAIMAKADGQVVDHFQPTADPESISFDGTDFWIGSFYADNVAVFDSSGQVRASQPADRRIFALDRDGTYMWAASYDNQKVYRFRLDTHESVAFEVAGHPYDLVTARGLVWVAVNRECATGAPPSCEQGALLELDAVTGEVRDEVEAPPSSHITFGFDAIWLASDHAPILVRITIL
jgi:outer membrane protein assembly factor BamB